MTTKAKDIATLVELFATSGWDELHVESDGIQVFLSKDPNARLAGAGTVSVAQSAVSTAPTRNQPEGSGVSSETLSSGSKAPPTQHRGGDSPPAEAVPNNWVAVTAPNLGTFYRAPKPGAAPLVQEGQSVLPDTEVCLLEVMKLFTTVKAAVPGVIRRICVEDGQMVEFGQALFYIERT
jgi:acetyl-CoA carboxylase biotin carboxyl carrier protein